MTDSGRADAAKRALHATFALSVLYVLVADLSLTPYEDSYFFKRIALHWIQYGTPSWNVQDGPVYGITSQLFQVVVLALTRLAPSHVVVGSKVTLALILVLTGGVLASRCGALTRRAVDGAALALVALASPLVLTTLHTGMETALALLLLTITLGMVAGGGALRPVLVASMTALVYTCRPDAALVPTVAFLFSHRRERRVAGVFVATLVVLLGACFLGFDAYYGSPLPLPFYAKTLGLGTDLAGIAALSTPLHTTTFLALVGPLVPPALARRNERGGPFAIAAIVFFLYHASFTHEAMGYRARFYVPAIVPLAFAAAAGWDDFTERLRRSRVLWALALWLVFVALLYALELVAVSRSARLERIAWQVYLVPAIMVAALALGATRAPRTGTVLALGVLPWVVALSVAPPPGRRLRIPTDADYVQQSSTEATTVRGVWDVLRCIPNLRQLYHSEVGIPGLLFPEARVVDLAGLMSNDVAFHRHEFDDYCLADRPEALFLPHKTYRELNRRVAASRCLSWYTRVTSQSSSPLYVRDDLIPGFVGCARDVWRWQ